MAEDDGMTEERDDPADFRTTHWSIVLAAGHSPSPQAYEALTKLCQTYRKPVLAFVRCRGHDFESAKDLTQSFFVRLIETPDFLQAAHRERGRFRAFLRTAVRNFLGNVREREHAVKRGGRVIFVSLDEDKSDGQRCEEPADERSPDKAFDRRWALDLIEMAMARLQREFVETGKGDQFEIMQEFLPGSKHADISYAEAASRLKSSEAAVRQAAHRMRCRFRHHLRAEVAQTVGTPSEVEEELNSLLTALQT
jgi:RNA polymerase sigma-70 factor (ECF subfamily)